MSDSKSTSGKSTSDLKLRTTTGIVFGVVVLGSIVAGYIPFYILITLVHLVALNEFYTVQRQNSKSKPLRIFHIFIGLAIQIFMTAKSTGWLGNNTNYYFDFLLPLLFIPFIVELFTKDTDHKSFESLGIGFLGNLYISVSFSCLILMSGTPQDYLLAITLGSILLIWSNDTFAYLLGRKIGKTPLFRSVSPNKTREGSIGGALCTLLISLIFWHYSEKGNVVFWMGFAVVQIITGALGDLIQSKWKRDLSIKDSGKLLPGHGGILDRFDALMFSAPFAYIYVRLFGG